MDKQKETIVEMYHLKSDLANELHYKQATEECELDNPLDIASAVIDLGYRKIPEGAVVLTREEYEKLKALKDDYVKGYEAGVDEGWDNARTETAKKFAERVKMAFYYEFDELIPSIMADKIDEICKEITEGEGMSETVTKVNGIPLDVLIEIARLINGNPKLLEDMANGYAVGYENGYKDAVEAVKEAVCREIAKPIYDNAGTLPIPKIKFEPYKPPELDISALYRYNQSITLPKEIMVAIKIEKTKEEKKSET